MNLVVDGRGYSGAPSTVDELSADVVREIATTLRVVNTKVKSLFVRVLANVKR